MYRKFLELDTVVCSNTGETSFHLIPAFPVMYFHQLVPWWPSYSTACCWTVQQELHR